MPSQQENQILQLAIQRGLITRTQSEDILQWLKTRHGQKRDGGSSPTTLTQLLLQRRYLTVSQLESLQAHQQADAQAGNVFLGKSISGFVPSSVLGISDIGITYVGTDTHYDIVVIKILNKIPAEHASDIAWFLEQMCDVVFLDHPQVAKVHEIKKIKQCPLIIREFVEGENLQEHLHQGRLPFKHASEIILEAARGLQLAHEVGLVHRNLKPTNILLDLNGHVRLTDFSFPPNDLHYLSPEQCRGGKSDARADIYSLGIIYYQLLTGHPPFEASSARQLIKMHQQTPVPSLRGQLSSLPVRAEKILHTMLAKRRSERYQNISEVITALTEMLSQRVVAPCRAPQSSEPECPAAQPDVPLAAPEPLTAQSELPPSSEDEAPSTVLELEAIPLAQRCSDTITIEVPKKISATKQENLVKEYQLLERLGGGVMGEVFKARSHTDNRLVALKLIAFELTRCAEFTQRFLREMQAIFCLHHPHIVRPLDCGVDLENNIYFVVMEFVEGESLQKRLERTRTMAVPQALAIVRQVADGLQHAYERGIIHRDIKPDNILLGPKDQAKITDFGLSKASWDDAGLTQAGDIVGTPYYIAPEQAMGEDDIDIGVDIYSLGITLYHMLAGQPPFTGGNSLQIIMSHTLKPLPSIKKFVPQISPAVLDLLARMTAKQRQERFATPAEIVKAIDHIRLPKSP